jgi:hypothetical protein
MTAVAQGRTIVFYSQYHAPFRRLAKAPEPDPAQTQDDKRFAVQVAAVTVVQSEQYRIVPFGAVVPRVANVIPVAVKVLV